LHYGSLKEKKTLTCHCQPPSTEVVGRLQRVSTIALVLVADLILFPPVADPEIFVNRGEQLWEKNDAHMQLY
jgi:hypothetical protein